MTDKSCFETASFFILYNNVHCFKRKNKELCRCVKCKAPFKIIYFPLCFLRRF